MRHSDLKNFMTHQHTESRNHFPNKTKHVDWTPLHVLRNPVVPRNPCWRTMI